MAPKRKNICIRIPVEQVSNFRWIMKDMNRSILKAVLLTMGERSPDLIVAGIEKWAMFYWVTGVESDLRYIQWIATACKGNADFMTAKEEDDYFCVSEGIQTAPRMR